MGLGKGDGVMVKREYFKSVGQAGGIPCFYVLNRKDHMPPVSFASIIPAEEPARAWRRLLYKKCDPHEAGKGRCLSKRHRDRSEWTLTVTVPGRGHPGAPECHIRTVLRKQYSRLLSPPRSPFLSRIVMLVQSYLNANFFL